MMTAPAGDKKTFACKPHGVLRHYYADEADKAQFVRDIFDRTANRYDRIENWLAFGLGDGYRRHALARAGLARGMSVLDVATGTGKLAREAATLAGDPSLVTGIDPSAGMLAHARLPAGVALVRGCAESLPFPDHSFDFLCLGYALRHVTELSGTFAEFRRVLKPGGRLCMLEITAPDGRIAGAVLKLHMKHLIPALARIAGQGADTAAVWRYYWDTIEACVAPSRVIEMLALSGFESPIRYLEHGIFTEYRAQTPDRMAY